MNVGTCSGTCSWSSLAGSPDGALNNGYSAARAFQRLGPSTLAVHVTACWSSYPSLAHFVFAWPGFVVGAGHSWNSSTPKSYLDAVMCDILDVHVLGEWANAKATSMPSEDEADLPSSAGQALLELGKAENELNEKLGPRNNLRSQSVFVDILMNPDKANLENLKIEDLNRALMRIKKAQNTLLKCNQPASLVSESYRHEILLTSELLVLSTKMARSLIQSREVKKLDVGDSGIQSLASTFRTDTANKYAIHPTVIDTLSA